ncbi:ABC transporter substrate-binding protein [Corynebacterium casei]|uniref:ABC transporter substrate-binding protein n=1 Tax=Corynebacterium casei TaxID=160386 RepID=UPI003F956F45
MTASRRRARILAPALALMTGLALTACASTGDESGSDGAGGDSNGESSGDAIVVGTTDKITRLDPAASYDNGTSQVARQIYGYLMESEPGSEDPTPVPSLAESGEFTSPSEFTVKLKEGLTFANGNELTSSDVKFSFDRQIGINDPNGPASLLGNLESVDTPDDLTVVFNLKQENDQTWVGVLNSPAGPIVDEEVFSADEVLDNQAVVDAEPFAGQYTISNFSENELISYSPVDTYQGVLGDVQNGGVDVRYYADASNMKLDIEQNNIDAAYRSLSATDIEDLRNADGVQVIDGPGGEIRYIVFNFNTQPFGATTEDADEEKAKAVRQAIAASIDRAAIAKDIYRDTFAPLYSSVPESMVGAIEPVKDLYLTEDGGPDVDKATQILEDAGVTETVNLALQYNPDHYGPSSGDEYAMIKAQLEETGLFTVDLQSTEWVQYQKDRVQDVYPLYQLGWFPDFSDPDNFLTPFFTTDSFLGNHFDNAEADSVIRQQAVTEDEAEREELLGQAQEIMAEELSTIPLLQGRQFAFAAEGVEGVTLDASYLFRYGSLSK